MATDSSNYYKEMSLQDIVYECVADSASWFPAISRDVAYSLMCLSGEVGEAQNILKKVIRGSLVMDERVHLMLCEEITDAFTYLALIAGLMQFDLNKAYQAKREINQERFGAHSNGS